MFAHFYGRDARRSLMFDETVTTSWIEAVAPLAS